MDDRYDNQMAMPLYSAVHHHFGTMAAGRAKLQPVPRLFQAAKASCLVDGRSQSVNQTLEFQVQCLVFWCSLQAVWKHTRRGIIRWTNWITRQMVWNDFPNDHPSAILQELPSKPHLGFVVIDCKVEVLLPRRLHGKWERAALQNWQHGSEMSLGLWGM